MPIFDFAETWFPRSRIVPFTKSSKTNVFYICFLKRLFNREFIPFIIICVRIEIMTVYVVFFVRMLILFYTICGALI